MYSVNFSLQLKKKIAIFEKSNLYQTHIPSLQRFCFSFSR
jgi:hypothetical protein